MALSIPISVINRLVKEQNAKKMQINVEKMNKTRKELFFVS